MENALNFVVLIASCIINVAAVITLIVTLVKKAKAPNVSQNERLDKIEKRLDDYDDIFKRDNKRLNHIEDGNRVTQRALLALLAHGIDGNEIDGLKKAKKCLEEYLIQG